MNFENFSTNLNLSQIIKENFKNYSSEQLCETIVVASRYLKMLDEETVLLCMQELATRRANGENFNFEDYMEKSYNSLPQLTNNLPNLSDLLRGMSKK